MSNRKKVLVVFGTRPEAIKMAPLFQELASDNRVNPFLCLTGQHKEMVDQVMEVFGLKEDYNLNIMKHNQSLSSIQAKTLTGIESIITQLNPELVLVHGDTTTALATSIASFNQRINVGHVEAGLRTHNLQSPFPEEYNRQMISKIAKLHFAPTEKNKDNLITEGVPKSQIFVTGNTVIDALLRVSKDIDDGRIKIDHEKYNKLISKKYILITGHRRENFGKGFEDICFSLKSLAKKFPDFNFIYPVHLNPQVQKPVKSLLSEVNNIFLLPPLNYVEFIFLLKGCYLVLTDSGGIQEEAPSLGKPVLVMRDETERPEALDSGTIKLVGSNANSIIRETSNLIENKGMYVEMASKLNPYGDGAASRKIKEYIISS